MPRMSDIAMTAAESQSTLKYYEQTHLSAQCTQQCNNKTVP